MNAEQFIEEISPIYNMENGLPEEIRKNVKDGRIVSWKDRDRNGVLSIVVATPGDDFKKVRYSYMTMFVMNGWTTEIDAEALDAEQMIHELVDNLQ